MAINRYTRNTYWKFILGLAAMAFVVGTVWYTTDLAADLKVSERQRMEIWAEAQRNLTAAAMEEGTDCDLSLHLKILESNHSIPMILVDEGGTILDARNYAKELEGNQAFFETQLQHLQKETTPIRIESAYFKMALYYEPSAHIVALEWFPVVQFGLLILFLLLGYWAFSTARRAEQEKVWLGMAKETAHQLGTPISSLLGWNENLKLMYEGDENIQMISSEIEKDVDHLEIVAERFSKIGSKPDLTPINLIDKLHEHKLYIKRRASRRIHFSFPDPVNEAPIMVPVNSLLFDWVIENLLKNALDAMGGKGKISVTVQEDAKFVYLDINDTGKGIPRSNFKTIFKPGFSTKQRGWGLGLSLTKRIVERYHGGKVFVKQSVIGKGTTFRIQLKK